MPGGPGEDGNSVNNKTTGSLGSPLLAGGQKEVEDTSEDISEVINTPTALESILLASNHQDTRNTIKQNYSKQIILYVEIFFENKLKFDGGLYNISLIQFPEKTFKEIIELCNLIQRLVNLAEAYNEEIDDTTLCEAIGNYAENILSMDPSYLISLKEAIPGITLSHLFSGYNPGSRDIPSMFMNYPIFKLNKGKAVEQCINNIKGLNTLFKTTISAQDLIDYKSLNHCIWNMKTENAKQQILLFLTCEYEKGGITALNHLGRIEPNIFDTLGNDGITADEISQLRLPGVDNKQITKIVFIKKHEELFKNLLNTGYIEPNDLYDGDWFLNNLQSIVTQMGEDVPGCEINSAEQIKNYCTKHIENYYTSDGSFFSMYRPKLFDQKLLQQHIISLMGKGKRNRVSLDYLPSMLDHLETIGYKLEDLPYAIKQDLLIAGLEYLPSRMIAAIMRVLTQEEKEQYVISMLIAKMADDSNNETVNRFIISYDKTIDLSELYKKLHNKFPSLRNMGKMSVEERITLIQTTFFQGETRIKDKNNYNKMVISRHFGEKYIADYLRYRYDFLMHNPYVAEIHSGDSIKTFNELLQKFDTYDNPSLKQYLTDAQNYFQNDCKKLPYLRSFERFNQLLATYGTYEDVGFKKYVTDAQDYFSKVNDIPQLDNAKKFDELLEKYGRYESKDFQSYLTNVIDYFSKVKKISGLDTLEKFDELVKKYGTYNNTELQTYLTNAKDYLDKTEPLYLLGTIEKFDELLEKYKTYESTEFQTYLANALEYLSRVKYFGGINDVSKFDELTVKYGAYKSPKFQTYLTNVENYFSKVKNIASLYGIVKFDELVAKYGTYENSELQTYLANVEKYFATVTNIPQLHKLQYFETLYLGRKSNIDEYLTQSETATQIHSLLNKKSNSSINDSYITEVLQDYQNRLPELIALYATLEADEYNRFSENSKIKIKELMEQGEGKTLAYDYMYNLVKNIYTNRGTTTSMIDDVLMINLEETGVGNLGFIETLANHAHIVQQVCDTNKFPITKQELSDLGVRLKELHKKRSQETINNIYNIATEILTIAPSLYITIVSGMLEMKSADLQHFVEHIYPLYHVELILHDNIQKTPRALVDIRNHIKNFFRIYNDSTEYGAMVFSQEKQRMSDIIKNLFQSKFGIIKLPDQLTQKQLETIQNHALYLANLNGQDKKHEALLGFYLALQLHNKRDDFRAGVPISPTEYVNNNVGIYVLEYMKVRSKTDILKGLPQKEQIIVQGHEISQLLGDATTIDIVLHTINESVHQLLDQDLYTGYDQVLLETLGQHGKEAGGALAMQFQVLSGKIQALSPDHQEIIRSIEQKTGVSLQEKENITSMQQILNGLSPIINMVKKVKQINITGKLDHLKKLLIPPESLVQLFTSWGVEMNQGSGVLASLDDVHYLRALASKHQDELSEDQKKEIETYFDTIDQKLMELYTDKDLLQNMFDNFQKQVENGNNTQLKATIQELSPIFLQNKTNNKDTIISELTTDLNVVIKNIRACLACKEKGVNNDTNLTFGDTNKFFVISHNNSSERSYADQLVHLLETTQGKNFVMDLIYGKPIPDVLTNHIFTVCNKLSKLPDNTTSIFVSDKVMKQSALTGEYLKEKLSEQYGSQFSIEKQTLDVTIQQSGASDGYYEFMDGKNIGRVNGIQSVSGWVIKKKNKAMI